jgi:acylphosphatase
LVVSGEVQGVFYRAATQATARRLGLSGWVRNRDDGTVELVACGEEAALAELEAWLWRGPPAARVRAVEPEPASDPGLDDFELRR